VALTSRQYRRHAVAGVSLAATLALPASAQALDLEVDTTIDQLPDDDCGTLDECTLRDAIDRINDVGAPSNTITFQAGLSGTITLTQGEIEIMDNLTIQGPGADVLTVSGGNVDRIFFMQTVGVDTTISGLTLTDGNTAGDGGAIRADDGALTMTGTTVSGNNADDGGGIFVSDTDLTVQRSTLSGNDAGSSGGAIGASQARVTVESSTISGNMAPGGTGSGGGIYFQSMFASDVVSIRNSTVAGNTAGGNGGGIAAFPSGSTPDPTLTNTIVADNTAPFPDVDLRGPFDASFSLVEVGSVDATVPGSNITGQDAQLGLLVNNGGPTLTRKPAAGSPVIDRGSTAATTDQRAKARPFDVPHILNSAAAGADGADIGAVELTGAEAGVKKCGGKGATIIGRGRRVNGTNKADVIVGTAGANVIKGKGGRDRICGLGGKDTLIGGGGGDTLIGGGGADILRGGPGRDKLKGGPGRDTQIQ